MSGPLTPDTVTTDGALPNDPRGASVRRPLDLPPTEAIGDVAALHLRAFAIDAYDLGGGLVR